MQKSVWGSVAVLTTALPLAWAHAVLLESSPLADKEVQGSAVPIVLHFNSRIDGKRSRLSVACAGGGERVVTLEPQSAPERIGGTAGMLTPGICTARWQVLAADGHITRGQFKFRVK